MKKLIVLFATFHLVVLTNLHAQILTNNGADLTINPGSTLTIQGSFQNLDDGSINNAGDINITGDWTNNATTGNLLQGTTGTVLLNGTTTQQINGSNQTWFNKLHLQSNATLGADISVSTDLSLASSILGLNNHYLVVQSGGTILGAGPSAYLVTNGTGKLVQEVANTNTIFPVGTLTSYTPAMLNNSGTSDNIGIRVFADVLDGGITGSTIPEIDHCVNLTWDISEQTAGGSDLSITTQWNVSDEGVSFDRAHCGIGHFTSGSWDPQDESPAAGSNPYIQTRTGITNLSAFAVGDINSPMAITLDLLVDINVFLEGPHNGIDMNTDLNANDMIPLAQPFNTAPWNYSGSESVAAIPNANVVDWFLIELRDAPDAASALPATIIAQQAAFILKDGSVVGMDGFSNLSFSNTLNNQLFVVVWHRNHLGIMSAFPVTQTGGIYTYDFTSSASQAYGSNAQKNLSPGVFGLFGGDANADGIINASDKLLWVGQSGKKGYLSGDANMDTQVGNQDKNDITIGNLGQAGQVPQ